MSPSYDSLTLILLLISVGSILTNVFVPNCPKDWYTFQDSCYTIISFKTHWLSGYSRCETLKSTSIQIETTQEANFIHNTLYYVDSDIYFYTGAEDFMRRGFLKWFRTNIPVPDELLCAEDRRDQHVTFASLIGEIKKAGIYDVDRKCIASVDGNLKYHMICERNCTKFDCLRLKNERYDTGIVLAPDDSCAHHKCAHNSTCTPVPRVERHRNRISVNNNSKPTAAAHHEKTTQLKYKCHCGFGFVGMLCEQDTRACFTPPLPRCRNNGTCVQSTREASEFECECVYGFRGRLCEENMLCENVTCLNGGLCVDGICQCGPYFSGDMCEIKATDLVVLETLSKSVSALAVGCVIFYLLLIVTLDALKYIFHMEPSGLDEQRRDMRFRYALKRVGREKDALTRRLERLDRIIKKLRDYRFHYLRWRGMRFIDDPTASSSSHVATTSLKSIDDDDDDDCGAGVSTREASYFSSFSLPKLANT